MKSDHMERFVVLPFSIGCSSHSCVSVAATCDPKRPKSEARPPLTTGGGGGEGSTTKDRMKNPSGFMLLPKPNISYLQKLLKSIKSLSQIFVYKEETQESEREMEIGYPTDVKHVTHIGLDGSSTTDPIKGWEQLKAPEIFSFPSFSLAQLEMAMAAQAHGPIDMDPSKLS